MPVVRKAVLRCPVCRETVVADGAKPFCSERCRQDDLARWLGGRYRIDAGRADVEMAEADPTLPLDAGDSGHTEYDPS